MKKIGLVFREASEKRIRLSLKESKSAFIIKYSGLSSPDITYLRQALKSSSSALFVVKNSIARRAFKDSGLGTLVDKIEGPCGIVFSKDDPVNTSKVLFNFYKEHEQLKLEGGFLEERALSKNDIERLASLPSKEVLRAKAVAALKSPLSGLAGVLNQVLRKFIICLEEIRKKKEAQ